MASAGRLERDGELGQAEDIYRSILRRYPEHVEAMRRLANIATKHRKYSDAEVFLKEAVRIAPDYARAWLDLSVAQLDQEKLEEAMLEIKPDWVLVYGDTNSTMAATLAA